jgi:hypothetical protein
VSGNDGSTAGRLLQTFSIARVSRSSNQRVPYLSRTLSLLHSLTELLSTKPHTHTPQSDLRAPTVLIIP